MTSQDELVLKLQRASAEIESLRQCLEGACEERDQAQDERDEWKKLCFLMMMVGDRTTADLYNQHVDADGNLKASRDETD